MATLPLPYIAIFAQNHIGAIPPVVGLVTNAGIITKVNEKSIVIGSGEDERNIKVGANGWPSMKYVHLTDEQLDEAIFEEAANPSFEALRLVFKEKSDDNTLLSVIEEIASFAIANGNSKSQTIWAGNKPDRGLSQQATFAAIKALLS